MFRRVLVANRGEIACRVIGTCRRLGIHSIAVYSEADRHARHVRLADEAHLLGPPPAAESYLDIGRVLAIARASRAEAVHPGYGFLSENTDFAAACADAGIEFIGPRPDAIRRMGLKHEAKALAQAAGVPVVPGYAGEDTSPATLEREAARIGYPLLVKAVAGGGGKGMRVVRDPRQLVEAAEAASREAAASFRDGRILLEKFIERPRHIEVQVFGDTHGRHLHLFERECSVQRRYQKIIEESPSPFLSPGTRERMTGAAVRAAAAAGYVNAGTVEFVVSPQGDFYFLEMNTRLQVEHPVTEMVTGLDLVEWQLRVAAGEALPMDQDAVQQCGHAIEARLYSEDPRRAFLPSVGVVERFAFPPEDASWRVDRGIEDGDRITVHYDPMIAKVIAAGADRPAAIRRLRQCLSRTAVFGPAGNLDLLRRIAAHPDFAAAMMDTGYLDRHLDDVLAEGPRPGEAVLLAAADYALSRTASSPGLPAKSPWAPGDAWRLGGPGAVTLGLSAPGFLRLRARRRGEVLEIEGDGIAASATVVAGEHDTVTVAGGESDRELTRVGHGRRLLVTDETTHDIELVHPWPYDTTVDESASHPASPLPGRVVVVHVASGERVTAGQAMAVVEGMKMQHTIRAGMDGTVSRVRAEAGQLVDADAVLFEITAD